MKNPENFQEFEVSTHDAEWADNPQVYITDPSIYQEYVDKAKKAMAEIGANIISFYMVGEHPEAGFLVDLDDDQDESEATNEYTCHDGDKVPAVRKQGVDFEICWNAPMLEVSQCSTRLVWQGKHCDAEAWVYLGLK